MLLPLRQGWQCSPAYQDTYNGTCSNNTFLMHAHILTSVQTLLRSKDSLRLTPWLGEDHIKRCATRKTSSQMSNLACIHMQVFRSHCRVILIKYDRQACIDVPIVYPTLFMCIHQMFFGHSPPHMEVMNQSSHDYNVRNRHCRPHLGAARMCRRLRSQALLPTVGPKPP